MSNEIIKNKPIIGISSSIITDSNGSFAGYQRAYVNKDYVDAVIKAGGIPFIIPFSENEDVIKEQASIIDGLIISGGHDVSPYNYGQEPHQKLGDTFPERDKYETILYNYSTKEKNIPVLGICRGMQLINVIENGTLFQDLSLIPNKNVLKHNQVSNPTLKTHKIEIKDDSILKNIFGKETMVNSFHHQALDKVGNNLEVIARASDDVVEAVKHKEFHFVLGVQWHPEMLAVKCQENLELFKLFILEALKNKNK
jgi:anthranilate synthase component II